MRIVIALVAVLLLVGVIAISKRRSNAMNDVGGDGDGESAAEPGAQRVGV